MAAAQDLDPPGPLRDENQHMIEALQLRVSGVQGLADTFAANSPRRRQRGEAALLAAQADRLLASDVVWDDLFAEPSRGGAEATGRQRRRRCPTRTSSPTAT